MKQGSVVRCNIVGCIPLKGESYIVCLSFLKIFCLVTKFSLNLIRFIRTLKNKVTNTASVEGSISAAYLVEETSTFASYYYPSDIPSRRTRVPRNDDGGEGCSINPTFSIFNYPGRPAGRCISCFLEEREMKAAHLYVLLNCPEVEPYLK